MLGTIAHATTKKELVEQIAVVSVRLVLNFSPFMYFMIQTNKEIRLFSDCQNRFSTGMDGQQQSSNKYSAGNSNASNGTNAFGTNSYGVNSSGTNATRNHANRNLFESGTYETIANSLFATAKQCHQNRCDDNTTTRKILETFQAGLSRIHEDIEKKSRHK